jgi:hypothetical protein
MKMLRLQNGLPVLITQEEFEACCCDDAAPTTCPCASWPDEDPLNPGYADPTGFPCGGLLYQYSLDVLYYEEQFHDGVGDCSGAILAYNSERIKNTTTLTATTTSCTWKAENVPSEWRSGEDEPSWNDCTQNSIMLELLSSGGWRITASSDDCPIGFGLGVVKTTGKTPVGNYGSTTCFDGGGEDQPVTVVIEAAVS